MDREKGAVEKPGIGVIGRLGVERVDEVFIPRGIEEHSSSAAGVLSRYSAGNTSCSCRSGCENRSTCMRSVFGTKRFAAAM